jgi:hypothetical protein
MVGLLVSTLGPIAITEGAKLYERLQAERAKRPAPPKEVKSHTVPGHDLTLQELCHWATANEKLDSEQAKLLCYLVNEVKELRAEIQLLK